MVQEAPSKEELFKQKQVTKEKNRIHGVRMGAGDRSYLVRDNEISVFKNRYGGVEVCSLSFGKLAQFPENAADARSLSISQIFQLEATWY